jgi:hypothetical protein
MIIANQSIIVHCKVNNSSHHIKLEIGISNNTGSCMTLLYENTMDNVANLWASVRCASVKHNILMQKILFLIIGLAKMF